MRNVSRAALSALVLLSACSAAADNSREPEATATPALAVAPVAAPVAAPPEPPAFGRWDVSESTDKMDGVTNVTLMLMSDDVLPLAFPYNDRYGRLVIRCKQRKTDLYVVTQTPVRSNYGEFDESDIRYRFDDGKPIHATFSESTDNSAIFAPSPVHLAKRLASAKKWLVEFTPYDAGPVTVSFSLDGLAGALPKVSAACGWQ